MRTISHNKYFMMTVAGLALLATARVSCAQDANTIPYDQLQREVQVIVTDIKLGTNALGNSQHDVYQLDCGRADRELVFASVNLELARVEIPNLRDRLTRVEPNMFGGIQGRINKLQSDLNAADTSVSGSEVDLDAFAQHFVTACPDHPMWDSFLQGKSSLMGSAGYKDFLNKIAQQGESGFTAQTISSAAASAGAGGAGSGGGNLTPDGNNASDSATTAFLANPSDPAAKAALASALASGPDPLSPDEVNTVLTALQNKDLPTLLAMLGKHPQNKALRDAIATLMASMGKSPAEIDQAIKAATAGGAGAGSGASSGGTPDATPPAAGSSIKDEQGNVGKVVDAHTTVFTTSGPTGILTSETKETGDFFSGQFKSSAQKTISWQFSIVPVDGGFELQDHSAAMDDPDKGFNVQAWTVTGPSGTAENFPGGNKLTYAMKSGSYTVQANVTTKLGTPFTISATLQSNQ